MEVRVEITEVVAEYISLLRQAKSAPLALQDQQRMQELKGLLLAAQRQPASAGKDRPAEPTES